MHKKNIWIILLLITDPVESNSMILMIFNVDYFSFGEKYRTKHKKTYNFYQKFPNSTIIYIYIQRVYGKHQIL